MRSARRLSKTLTRLQALTLVVVCASAAPVLAETTIALVSFDEAWRLVKKNSAAVRAATQERQATEIGASRAEQLWLPRVYTELRAYSTDDPANSFMSVLNQRQIGASDLTPDALNHPSFGSYQRATLGVDLPLYEGGGRAAGARVAKSMADVRAHEQKATLQRQYLDLAKHYANMLALNSQAETLERLASTVNAIIQNYRIGAKSNPVGYSGLLGLKNLRNRLEAALAENRARYEGARQTIARMANELPQKWVPAQQSFNEFAAQYLADNGTDSISPQVEAQRSMAKAADDAVGAERARYLPRVGLFAEENMYAGDRDTATAHTVGIYLQWDLFSAQRSGVVDQSRLSAEAAQARAEAALQRSRIEAAAARRAQEALAKNIQLMDQSEGYLQDQTESARDLFNSGAINALQLVEVLARRVDLLQARTAAQLELVEKRVGILMQSDRIGTNHEG